MAKIPLAIRRDTEHLLRMSGGYVLEFTSPEYQRFVHDTIGIDPFKNCNESKAKSLRNLWDHISLEQFATLTLEMLEARDWEIAHNRTGYEETEADRTLAARLREQLSGFAAADPTGGGISVSDDFLAQKIDIPDLSQLPVSEDVRPVLAARLTEAKLCLDNGAYLAVLFLCGSTLEGVLLDTAKRYPAQFNTSTCAPKGKDGKVRDFADWRLSDLLRASHDVGAVTSAAHQHAIIVRDFRNWIHPAQQAQQKSQADRITAEMAAQVLRAVIHDLAAWNRQS